MSKPYAHLFSYLHKIEDEHQKCVVSMYCLSPTGNTSIVKMKEFQPYFFLELPKEYQDRVRRDKVAHYLNQPKYVKTCACRYMCPCAKQKIQLKWSWVDRKRLYFVHKEKIDDQYVHKKEAFIKIEFPSIKLLEVFSSMFKRPIKFDTYTLSVKIHEGNQLLLQFFATTRLPSIGWVDIHVPKVEESDKMTILEGVDEYVCSYRSVVPSLDDSILLPKVMTFDIEAYSHVHTAMPNVWDSRDSVFQISIVLAEKKKIKKILLSLGNPDPIEDVTIMTFTSESQLLLGFMDYINTEGPNVILGYNTFGFDLRYILRRGSPFPDYLKKKNEKYDQEPVYKIPRLYDIHPYSRSSKPCKEQHEVWSSNAFGKQDLTILDIDGIIMIDLYLIIKREFKLLSYKLDAVAEFFLGSNKDPLTPKDIFKCYESGTPKSLALVGKYCVQDSYLTYLLFEKLQVWVGQCEMAKTTKVPIMWLCTKGQQIKIYSQILHYGQDYDFIVENEVVSYEDISYKGATVYAPEPGIYHNVMAFDFASLYPSIIISHNIDYTSLVRDDCKTGKEVCDCMVKCVDTTIPDEDCHVFEWSEHEFCEHDLTNGVSSRKADKMYCGQYRYRFLKHQVSEKGIIPTIIASQLDARKKTRKELAIIKIKLEETKMDEEERKMLELRADVLEERQKSYKINANSMYGVLGARKGYLPLLPAAMCVTYVGRQSIKKASNYISKEHKGTILYGDTDSCFCTFENLSLFELHQLAQQISKETQALFPEPMKLEYEGKIYKDFFILSKKRYMARSCDEYGNMSLKILKKGVQTQRRDSTKILKKIFDESIIHIMDGLSYEQVFMLILDDIKKMFTFQFEDKYFMITKSLAKDDYKSKPPQVVLKEKMERRGKLVPTGSRIDYFITTTGGYKAQQSEKIEEDSFYKTCRSVLKLDYLYYLEHQLVNPLNEIIEKAFKKNTIRLFLAERVNYHKVILQLKHYFDPVELDDEIPKPVIKPPKKSKPKPYFTRDKFYQNSLYDVKYVDKNSYDTLYLDFTKYKK